MTGPVVVNCSEKIAHLLGAIPISWDTPLAALGTDVLLMRCGLFKVHVWPLDRELAKIYRTNPQGNPK